MSAKKIWHIIEVSNVFVAGWRRFTKKYNFKQFKQLQSEMEEVKSGKEPPTEMLEIVSNTSLSEFLKNEENCENDDVNSIFDEISRLTSLSDNKFHFENDNRTIEDILKEAESLINQPLMEAVPVGIISISCESTPMEIRNNIVDQYDYSITLHDVSHLLIFY